MAQISLNEAITRLMGEEPRTPEQEDNRRRKRSLEFQQHLNRFHADWANIPGDKWSLPLPRTAEEIAKMFILSPYPDPLSTLARAAHKHHSEDVQYAADYDTAMRALLFEAIQGNLRIFGRTHPKMSMFQIDKEGLAPMVRIDQSFKHLEASLGRPDGQNTTRYYDVTVAEDDLRNLLSSRSPTSPSANAPPRVRSLADEELLAWIHHRDQRWFRELHGPAGHQRQAEELKKQFPNLKGGRARLTELNAQRPFRRPVGHPKSGE